MKLIGSKTEDDLRRDFIAGIAAIFYRNESPLLLNALKELDPKIEYAVVIHSVPEQDVHFYDVLVSDCCVFKIEIPTNGMPFSSRQVSVREYKKQHSSKAKQIKLAVAIDVLKSTH